MDNLTHTLVGAALAESGLKRYTPLATPTLLIAANLPDIDIISGVFGPAAYLEWHRGLTHSLIGFPIVAFLLAAAVHFLSRGRARFWRLLGLSLIGTATHPLLDFTNSYGWRPFLPFSDRWYFADLAFVIDPWIWLGIGGAVFLARSETRRSLLGWGILAALVTLLIMTSPVGWGVRTVWAGLVVMIIAARWVLQLQERGHRLMNAGALGGLALYLCVLALLHALAVFRSAEVALVAVSANEQVVELNALPVETNPLRWRLVVATETGFHVGDLDVFGGGEPQFTRIAREEGSVDAIEAAKLSEAGTRFLRFARFPVFRTTEVGDETDVDIEDIRFANVTNRFRVKVRVGKRSAN